MLEFFANPTTGTPQGKTHIGFGFAQTDSTGKATIIVQMPALRSGELITVTATDPAGNTSPFSGGVMS